MRSGLERGALCLSLAELERDRLRSRCDRKSGALHDAEILKGERAVDVDVPISRSDSRWRVGVARGKCVS